MSLMLLIYVHDVTIQRKNFTGLCPCEADIYVAILKPIIRKKLKEGTEILFIKSTLFLNQWICRLPFPKFMA